MAEPITLERIAVLDLAVACLSDGPDFAKASDTLRALGYTEPTADPLIGSRDEGEMLGGVGIIDFEDAPHRTEPNGCMIYVRGVEASRVAAELLEITDKVFPGSEPMSLDQDFYWNVKGKDGRPMVLCVSPKTMGQYAGYVLLFAAEGTGPTLAQ